MKKIAILPILFVLLFLIVIYSGCTESSPSSGNKIPPETEAAMAIDIALHNSTVKTYLTGNWSINDVALGSQTSKAGGGAEVTLNTPDVIIETDSDYVHAYVDLKNNTVDSIWIQEKRTPLFAPPG